METTALFSVWGLVPFIGLYGPNGGYLGPTKN